MNSSRKAGPGGRSLKHWNPGGAFSTLFRAATGGGVVEYTKRLRMARARELLITSSRDIGDIADAVGYPDAFYFSRQFRTVHGCSPSEYRAANRAD